MQRTPHVLSTAADVRALLRDLPVFGGHAARAVSVRASSLDARAQQHWERRISLWLTACGCQAGAMAVVGALVWRVGVGVPFTWVGVGALLGWVFGAALVGKIIGLAVARLMIVVDLRRLSRQLEATP